MAWDLSRTKTLHSWFCRGGPTSRQSFKDGDDSLDLAEVVDNTCLVEAAFPSYYGFVGHIELSSPRSNVRSLHDSVSMLLLNDSAFVKHIALL